jgi:hypothetical protein
MITGGATTILSNDLTASKALVSDTSGKDVVSSVSSTELGYLSGVTSAIQTQLNAKQATITGGATTIAASNLTGSRALVSNSSGKVAVSAVTSTELGYLTGVTSNVQTQINTNSENFYALLTELVSIFYDENGVFIFDKIEERLSQLEADSNTIMFEPIE